MKSFFVSFVNGQKFYELYENGIRLKLDKKIKTNINFKIKTSPMINSNEKMLKIRKKYTEQINKCLINFEKILKNENINLTIYYKNLKSLKISKSNFVEKRLNRIFRCSGWYLAQKNEINFSDISKVENTVYHELLHMASSIYNKKDNFLFCGFNQCDYDKNKVIGKSLNEGYTELLNQKYFSPDNSSYWTETIVAQMLEHIIGKEKMIEFYFKADLNGLIDEFSKYAERENIIKFLVYLDIMCEYLKTDKIRIVREKLNEYAKFIFNFLNKSYHNSINLSSYKFSDNNYNVLNEFRFDFKISLAVRGVSINETNELSENVKNKNLRSS